MATTIPTGGSSGFSATVGGLPELKAELARIAPTLRKRALGQALRTAALVVRKAARDATPVLSPLDNAVLKGWRKPGTLKKAISVRPSGSARRQGDVGVFVNVRPAKGARYRTIRTQLGLDLKLTVRQSQRGAKSPDDPFYWRFVNWGWTTARGSKAIRGVKFLEAGAARLPQALDVFTARIGPVIQRFDERNAGPKA